MHAIVVDDVDFTPDLPAMLRAVTPQTRLIFLASPNNPTGTRVTNEALDDFLRKLPPTSSPSSTKPTTNSSTTRPTPSATSSRARASCSCAPSRKSRASPVCASATAWPRRKSPTCSSARASRSTPTPSPKPAPSAGLADVEHQQKTKAITDEGRKLIEDEFLPDGPEVRPLARRISSWCTSATAARSSSA